MERYGLKIYLAAFMLIAFTGFGQGQQIKSSVLGTSGAFFKGNTSFIDEVVGEAAVTTIRNEGVIITQGFLQPIELKIPCLDEPLLAFPNPASDRLTLSSEGCDLVVDHVVAFDLFGRRVLDHPVLENDLDLTGLGIGVYLIRAMSNSDQLVGTVKIVKIDR